jgi:hypothetical protein
VSDTVVVELVTTTVVVEDVESAGDVDVMNIELRDVGSDVTVKDVVDTTALVDP